MASRFNERRKRWEDLAFMERLKTASLEELQKICMDHAAKDAPAWKQVAIQRALLRRFWKGDA